MEVSRMYSPWWCTQASTSHRPLACEVVTPLLGCGPDDAEVVGEGSWSGGWKILRGVEVRERLGGVEVGVV